MNKKYVSLSKLSTFLDNLKGIFAPTSHSHKIEELSDYVVDNELSSISNNPVANCIIDAEFDAVSSAMGALEGAIDEKASKDHSHDDRYLIGTDRDLVQDGVAADAKATGESISEMYENVVEYVNESMSNKTCVQLWTWGADD